MHLTSEVHGSFKFNMDIFLMKKKRQKGKTYGQLGVKCGAVWHLQVIVLVPLGIKCVSHSVCRVALPWTVHHHLGKGIREALGNRRGKIRMLGNKKFSIAHTTHLELQHKSIRCFCLDRFLAFHRHEHICTAAAVKCNGKNSSVVCVNINGVDSINDFSSSTYRYHFDYSKQKTCSVLRLQNGNTCINWNKLYCTPSAFVLIHRYSADLLRFLQGIFILHILTWIKGEL